MKRITTILTAAILLIAPVTKAQDNEQTNVFHIKE
jgi:hypothetical protein